MPDNETLLANMYKYNDHIYDFTYTRIYLEKDTENVNKISMLELEVTWGCTLTLRMYSVNKTSTC